MCSTWKLSDGTNVALTFNPADFVKMVSAQDLKKAARPQARIFKRLCATTNSSQPSALRSIVLTSVRCVNDGLGSSFGCWTGENWLMSTFGVGYFMHLCAYCVHKWIVIVRMWHSPSYESQKLSNEVAQERLQHDMAVSALELKLKEQQVDPESNC
jgi:hypothetical protein